MSVKKWPQKALTTVIVATTVFLQNSVLADDRQGPYNIAKDAYIVRYNDVFPPVVAQNGMVSTQSDIVTRIGVEILNNGGNAIDAAVAVGFALTVTLPRAGNIGGGGFMVVHDATENHSYTIDYRETAPTGVTAEDFLDENGKKSDPSRFMWPAIGVPGTVAGLHKAWETGGLLEWDALLAPAISLAADGFPVNYDLGELLTAKQSWLGENEATRTMHRPLAWLSWRANPVWMAVTLVALVMSLHTMMRFGYEEFIYAFF